MFQKMRYGMVEHIWTLFKFGLVGSLAACVHLGSEYMLVAYGCLHPLEANMIAFSIAFFVSYYGHRYITFLNHTSLGHGRAMGRFFLVAVSGFMINQSLFYVFLYWFHLYYLVALFIVLCITPVITFMWSKVWVFGRHV